MAVKLRDVSSGQPEAPKPTEAELFYERARSYVDGWLKKILSPLVLQSDGVVAFDKQLICLEAQMARGEEMYTFLRGEQSRVREALEKAGGKCRMLKLKIAGRTGKVGSSGGL